MKIDEEMILSDGESLPMMSWERLMEYRANSNKLASKIGRTPHYAKKNKSNLQLIDEDIRMIDREINRRMALTTFSFCGLTFHWQGQREVRYGKWGNHFDIPDHLRSKRIKLKNKYTGESYWTVQDTVHILARVPTTTEFGGDGHDWYPQRITLTKTELEEYISRGAIQTKLDDPCAPFRVAECPWDKPGEPKE